MPHACSASEDGGGDALLQHQFKLDALGLAEDQPIDEAACGGQAIIANLKSDDGANNDPTDSAKYDTFEKKTIAEQSRHALLLSTAYCR
jgi:hypothetical protein